MSPIESDRKDYSSPTMPPHQSSPPNSGDNTIIQTTVTTRGSAPLRKWIECEVGHHRHHCQYQRHRDQEVCFDEKASKQLLLIRATTIAYGIAELLRHYLTSSTHDSVADDDDDADDPASDSLVEKHCTIDNFIIRGRRIAGGSSVPSASGGVKEDESSSELKLTTTSWSWVDIHGVDMISTGTSVNIFEPYFLRCSISENGDDQEDPTKIGGRYVEVEFTDSVNTASFDESAAVMQHAKSRRSQEADIRCCYSLGIVLHELFYHLSPHLQDQGEICNTATTGVEASGLPLRKDDESSQEIIQEEPARKRSTLKTAENFVPLLELGYPSSICLLVQNLLRYEGDDIMRQYDSLDAAIKDLHLLLLDPSRFLFDNEPSLESGSVQLLFREHKLYGRENEVSVITDAFCRVSGGRREALFIGGFSGSGKTRLVNGLSARVDVAGGYVISHTFDQMSKDRPLLAIVAVFNQLCLVIQEKNHRQAQDIGKVILQAFGSDISVLARLLPNIYLICPELTPPTHEEERNDQVTLRSMCFTIQRFLRVVSSKAHPVVLFLDDLQWCDSSSLTVVESILCDSFESNCLFFVGSYRSNEVAEDHGIFRLINNLRMSGVPTSTLSLEGLNRDDLNAMISDAVCLFPHMCESLTNIVHTKTKGNPLFVLEFLRSLVDGKLLNYSLRKRRWIWNEDLINGVETTDDVLFLLTSKMSALPDNIQSALKVGACFGLKFEESVVSILSTSPDYINILSDFEHVVDEGFMVKVGSSEFKFVHDKIQEAAYSLIPNTEKNKFHYDLGMVLHSMSKGKIIDGIVFAIADQINYDIDQLLSESPEVRIEIANVNKLAGLKARDCSDYARSCSYFTCAMSLLPPDRWKSHYEISLGVYFLLAESLYVRGESAEGVLTELLKECRSFDDKLPSFFLLAIIHFNNQKLGYAYSVCREVLSQRCEQIPQTVDHPSQAMKLIEETSKMVESISYGDLIAMQEMDNELSITMKFYNLITQVAFFSRPEILPYLIHRMIQLTMKYGFCKYSAMGFINYGMVVCSSNKLAKESILNASRLGKAALTCSKKRCYSPEQLPSLYCVYYGFVAFHTEPLQACADMLRQGFEAALSRGGIGTVAANSIQHVKCLVMAGESLPALLEKVNYYLELSTTYQTQTGIVYHTIFRETIMALIDKGGSTHPKPHPDAEETNANIVETMHFHRAIQAYWQGHSERCQYFADKFFKMSSHRGKLNGIEMTFINALNSFQLLKRQKSAKLRSAGKHAIAELKAAALNSTWNFSNKAHLLEAEDFSFNGKNEEAEASYTSAIRSAQFSRFIHEQGLACELAGYHYKKIGDYVSALSSFTQAKECYAKWGSQMKLDIISRELSLLQMGSTGPVDHDS